MITINNRSNWGPYMDKTAAVAGKAIVAGTTSAMFWVEMVTPYMAFASMTLGIIYVLIGIALRVRKWIRDSQDDEGY